MTREFPHKLPFTVRMALANWLAPRRQALENPTLATFRPYSSLAADASKALTYPITERHINSLIRSLGWTVQPHLRRSLASASSNTKRPDLAKHSTIKYATLCTAVRSLETRLASLESSFGITPPTSTME